MTDSAVGWFTPAPAQTCEYALLYDVTMAMRSLGDRNFSDLFLRDHYLICSLSLRETPLCSA